MWIILSRGNEISEINYIANLLIGAGVYLEEEGGVSGFLGVRMERDGETGILELNQIGLTDQIIEYLGFYVGTKKVK